MKKETVYIYIMYKDPSTQGAERSFTYNKNKNNTLT